MEFSVDPNLYVFQSVEPHSFLSFNDSDFLNPSFSFFRLKNSFSVSFSFDENIYLRPFELIFTANESISPQFWATSNTKWSFSISSEDPLLLAYYTDAQYSLSQIIFYLSIVITASSVLVCLLGICSPHKLAGLEAMFAVQYSSLCILWLDGQITLPFYCLVNLGYSTGYSYKFSSSVLSTQPPHALTFDFNALQLSSNFNFTGILYILPLVSLILIKIIYLSKSNPD